MPDELAGIAEIAEMLGLSRQRVYQLLAEHEDFPEPIGEISAGRVWDRADIERWGQMTGRLTPTDRS